MRTLTALCFVLLAFTPLFSGAAQIKKLDKINNVPVVSKPRVDLCPLCVQFMSQAINEVLNIILNLGVIGSCGDVCGLLPNQWESVACDLICSYVGIEAFVDLIEYEDPDPIFICQELDICPVVDGGAATITKTYVNPSSGPSGTTFTLGMNWQVTKQTGPGLLTNVVIPPEGFPMSGSEFTEGQTPGSYNIEFQLKAEPNEYDPFTPGTYLVQFAVCEGDCTNEHKWGGVYAEANTTFTITG